MIEAVIFDMDGLLVDSEVYWEQARREYCASQGCHWRREDELKVKGMNSPEWAATIKDRCGLSLHREPIIQGVTERMEKHYHQHLPLLPGAVDAVRAAAARFPLAVASSSPPGLIDYVLNEAKIRQCFKVTVSADTVGRGKPAPDVFLVAAEKLDVSPHHVVVLEDSSAGITAGHRAGMFVIAVPNPHYPPSQEALVLANMVLPSLEQFSVEKVEAAASGFRSSQAI